MKLEYKATIYKQKNPPSVEEIKRKIYKQCEKIIDLCSKQQLFYEFEKNLIPLMSQFGCLFIQLFLMSCHEKIDYKEWLSSGDYYVKTDPVSRVIKSFYGKVKYCRTYLIKKSGKSGLYPLDLLVGLTSDGFSPLVISLATKLATRMSFNASVLIFKCFCQWAPSTESVEHLVLGLGRQAFSYMETTPPPTGDGEILLIECDGKATPTATKKELEKRRGKRKEQTSCCQRHRSKAKRQLSKRKRRKRGDKSKNGKSTTLVVMYTLKKDKYGKLHGPINKKVWASYAPRKVTFAWIRRQATRRGFPVDTKKKIHIVVDGEKCLRQRLSELFPQASFALDIRHVEEKLWELAHLYCPQGGQELENWIDDKKDYLYSGNIVKLILLFKHFRQRLSRRAKRDYIKHEALSSLIKYLGPRISMMEYKHLIEQDLPIASGIVEGAARYVIGERFDCSGMRWIPERAEALLHLRCIELNGDWEHFFSWSYKQSVDKLLLGEKVMIRTNETIDLSSYTESTEPTNMPDMKEFEVASDAA